MLKFHWTRATTDEPPPVTRRNADDLRIRNLLDDPRLAKAMTLDLGDAFANAEPIDDLVPRRWRPKPVFNRRRLLEDDAA